MLNSRLDITMTKHRILLVLFGVVMLPLLDATAQINPQMLMSSNQFNLSQGLIRIAEQGQIADTVSVWGDTNGPGWYLVPSHSTIADVMTYSRGPSRLVGDEIILDWSKLRVEVTLSRYDRVSQKQEKRNYEFLMIDEIPLEMRQLKVKNGDVITLQVRRKPVFVDYVRVIAPALSVVLSTFIIFDRFAGN